VLTVTLVLAVAVYTVTYDHIPAARTPLASLMAAQSLLLAFFAFLTNSRRAIPLMIALLVVLGITAALQWAEIPQDFTPLLRYLTAIAGMFAIHMTRLPNLMRYISYLGMAVIAYAGYVTETGGPFFYAGTVRTWPFWSGLANSSFFIAALLLVIAVNPMKKFFKVLWVGAGLYVLAGYGAVTAILMVAFFFAGWYFLYRQWNRIALFAMGGIAVVGGILFRNANSVAGADIGSLGVGAIGSGRVDSWAGRLVEFVDRDFATQMLGRGPYSDYQVTELWYWAEKNAHSDLVTILMEFGIIGFVAIVGLWISAYRRTSPLGQVALLSIALGAMASNTFIDRPGVAIGWGLVLYACDRHTVRPRPTRRERIKPPRRVKLAPAYAHLEKRLQGVR